MQNNALMSIASIVMVLAVASPVSAADDAADATFDRECRSEWGIGATENPTYTMLTRLRRCILSKKSAAEESQDFERIQQRSDQQFWRRHDLGEAVLDMSRRSLKNKLKVQAVLRRNFYSNVKTTDRTEAVTEQRRARLRSVREREQEYRKSN
ncbi:hypothetical protein FJZ28_04455 [Candidatus Peregrinibacteria bacterium]|nr:hypothetical protein [Candidatus Peregrinibacteria bacterium]